MPIQQGCRRLFGGALLAVYSAFPVARAQGQAPAPLPPRVRVSALPAISSAPETGLTLGAVVFVVTRDPADTISRPTTHRIFAVASAEKQWRAAAETDAWFAHDAWRVNARFEYRVFPLSFYGLGVNAAERAEERYTPRGVLGLALVQRRIAPRVYALGGLRFWDQRVTPDTGGTLAARAFAGSTGGRVVLVEGGLAWDTRNDVLSPSQGGLVEVKHGISAAGVGSDFTYSRTSADLRGYRALGSRVVLAGQGVAEVVAGTPPFDQWSGIGTSEVMRGYALGRYRDRHLVSAQGEVRGRVTSRLTLAVFAGAGTVAPSIASLSEVRWLPTYGGGGRLRLFAGSNAAIRADVAIGNGAKGFYLAFNEAF